MKIVIDMDEEDLMLIHNSDRRGIMDSISKEMLVWAIRNGTPLPKGHGRLVDADALKESILCKTFGLRGTDIEKVSTIIEADKE